MRIISRQEFRDSNSREVRRDMHGILPYKTEDWPLPIFPVLPQKRGGSPLLQVAGADFEAFCRDYGYCIHERIALDTNAGRRVDENPNLAADLALMVLSK